MRRSRVVELHQVLRLALPGLRSEETHLHLICAQQQRWCSVLRTNVAKYSPRVVRDYFSTMWPGWDQDKLLEAFPERFDMVRHYRNRPIDNFVYYTQNRHDQRHYSRHYEPFRQAVGIKEKSGSSRDGSRHLVLYSGESQSHGGITAAEYDKFYADAFQRWRAHRGDA